MSAKSAVTVLRSPSVASVSGCLSATRIAGSFAVAAEPLRGSALTPKALPQSPQNLDAGAFSAPHFGQLAARPLPHWEQNFLPGAFSAPHFVQRIVCPAIAECGTHLL